MLQRSFRYFHSENPAFQRGSTCVFSNCDFSEQIVELPGFMLVEPGIQAVQLPLSYIISLIIYSPAVSPGAILTPPLEVAIQLRQIMCFYFDAFLRRQQMKSGSIPLRHRAFLMFSLATALGEYCGAGVSRIPSQVAAAGAKGLCYSAAMYRRSRACFAFAIASPRTRI